MYKNDKLKIKYTICMYILNVIKYYNINSWSLHVNVIGRWKIWYYLSNKL